MPFTLLVSGRQMFPSILCWWMRTRGGALSRMMTSVALVSFELQCNFPQPSTQSFFSSLRTHAIVLGWSWSQWVNYLQSSQLWALEIQRQACRLCTGGEGAPDVTESLRNLAINGAAVGILGYIFQRDLKGQQSDKRVIEREEALACLQVEQ